MCVLPGAAAAPAPLQRLQRSGSSSSSGGGSGWSLAGSIAWQALDATTGIPSMIGDVQTLVNGNASLTQKLLAGGDLAFNVVMDVTLVIGVGEGLRAAYVGARIAADVAEHVAADLAEHAAEDAVEHAAEDAVEHAGEDAVEHAGEDAAGVATETGGGLWPLVCCGHAGRDAAVVNRRLPR